MRINKLQLRLILYSEIQQLHFSFICICTDRFNDSFHFFKIAIHEVFPDFFLHLDCRIFDNAFSGLVPFTNGVSNIMWKFRHFSLSRLDFFSGFTWSQFTLLAFICKILMTKIISSQNSLYRGSLYPWGLSVPGTYLWYQSLTKFAATKLGFGF